MGEITEKYIEIVEKQFNIRISKYVIMPNHIHMIIMLNKINGNGHPQGASLQQIVGGYKSFVSLEYLKFCKQQNKQMGEIWQRSYHDHIIRNEPEYLKIWEYIDTNQLKWELDCYHIN